MERVSYGPCSPGLIRPPGPVLARQCRQVIRGTAQGRVRCGM